MCAELRNKRSLGSEPVILHPLINRKARSTSLSTIDAHLAKFFGSPKQTTMLVAYSSVGRDGSASRFDRYVVHRLNLGKNRGWRMLASGQYCAVADKLDCEIDLD